MPAIITSLYAEAAPLIRALHLKQKNTTLKWPVFENEDGSLVLLVTGTGRINAAGGVSALLTMYKVDHLLSVTSAAALHHQPAGSAYLISRLTDINTGFSYYPDLLISTDLPEAFLLTSDQILGNERTRDLPLPYDLMQYVHLKQAASYDLLDNEGTAVFQTASRFLGPHQIHLIRIVSDDNGRIEKEAFASVMQSASQQVLSYIRLLMKQTSEKEKKPDIDAMAEKLCCSITMKQQLKQLVRYAAAAKIDYRTILSDCMPAQGVCSREEGKKVLHEFTKRIAE